MNLFIFSRIVRRRGGGGEGKRGNLSDTFQHFSISIIRDLTIHIDLLPISRLFQPVLLAHCRAFHFCCVILKVSILSNWRTFFLFFFFFLSKRGGKISSLRKMKKLNRGRICDSLIMKYKKKSSISIRTRWDFYCDNSRKCVAIIFIWMYARAIIFNRTGNQIFHPFFYHFQSTRVCSF